MYRRTVNVHYLLANKFNNSSQGKLGMAVCIERNNLKEQLEHPIERVYVF